MSNLAHVSDGRGRISLMGEMTIYEADQLKTLLLEQLQRSPQLEIDLSGVTDIDCAGVQVMLLLRQEAQVAGKPLQWLGHSPVVAQVLGTLKLGSLLGESVSLVWS